MLASRGLATICQAIRAMIAAGLEVVSEAKPTATTHNTQVAKSVKPRPLRIKEPLGVARLEANANVPISKRAYALSIIATVTANAAGTRVANRARRERPVTTRSRKTPAEASPVPA